MTSPTFFQQTATVLEQANLATGTYRLRLKAEKIAATITPGQFVMVRVPDRSDPLLGRAFALYDIVSNESGQPHAIDIVYNVVGKMTKLLSRLNTQDHVEVWGPLGKPFPDYSGKSHLGIVAGGIGQTPFVALLKRVLGLKGYAGAIPKREVGLASVYYGARSSHYFAGLADFAATGAALHLTTDDGTVGTKGFVTSLVEQHILKKKFPAGSQLVGCGPEPMLHALSEVAMRQDIPCDVSLETPMACGIGICFSCVTKVLENENSIQWDYKRVCVEGPIFDAMKLKWEK